MRRGQVVLLALASCIALTTLATVKVPIPQVMRIVLGLWLVFVLPGFAFVSAVLSDRHLSRSEHLLASVGLSVAVTICAAVALAAMPVGLSRLSLTAVLTGCTLVGSVAAVLRSEFRGAQSRGSPTGGQRSRRS